MLVKELYNSLAIITGFPTFTSETDTPEITSFLLSCLSESLHSVINNIYIANNVLERTDKIVTVPSQDKYGIEGIIKQIQLVKNNGVTKVLPYLDYFNQNAVIEGAELSRDKGTLGEPFGYCIQGGYLRLFPVPDKEYNIVVTVSTKDLVWKNDDSSSLNITSVDDSVMADNKFCNLIVLRAASLIFSRARNANAEIYSTLFGDELRDYIEHDLKTIQGIRFFDRNGGHFRIDRGLLG